MYKADIQIKFDTVDNEPAKISLCHMLYKGQIPMIKMTTCNHEYRRDLVTIGKSGIHYCPKCIYECPECHDLHHIIFIEHCLCNKIICPGCNNDHVCYSCNCLMCAKCVETCDMCFDTLCMYCLSIHRDECKIE